MFVVEMDLRLGSAGERLTDDEITDLIERIVDELDLEPVAPSVGTSRAGDDVDMTISVVVDDGDQFEALRHGAAIISAGLQAVIGIGTARLVMPGNDPLTSSVRVLEPA